MNGDDERKAFEAWFNDAMNPNTRSKITLKDCFVAGWQQARAAMQPAVVNDIKLEGLIIEIVDIWAQTDDANSAIWEIAEKLRPYLRNTPDIDAVIAELEKLKEKVTTGPSTQNILMEAWDRAKSTIQQTESDLPRMIFESVADQIFEDIDAIIAILRKHWEGL